MKIGDTLVIKSQEELAGEGVDKNSPIFFLCGRNFPVIYATLESVRLGNSLVAQIVVDEKVRNILSREGYSGADKLKDGSFINIEANHVVCIEK